jgi:Putative transposase/Transposase zinc-binding domain
MALVTLQMIFQDAFSAYEQTHPLPAHVRKAARAIMPCRTAALGGPVQACPDGHVSRIWDNSCRHRACPQCASLQIERWLALQQARLLACDHSPVIFTLPHDLNPLWLANVAVMTSLLLQAVRETLGTLLAAPQYLGAQPGLIAALHTWSQTLVLPPHLHGLVPGGGLPPAGPWVPVRHGFVLPARVVMAVLRGKMVAAIRQSFARGALTLPEPRRPQQLRTLRHRLGHPPKTPWHVRIMERYRHGAGGVTSLARYLRGGPLKNARLVAYAGDRITCTYRAREEEPPSGSSLRQRMTVSTGAFLQRWRLHVPAPQTRVVRCSGLSHHTHAEALAVCRAHLGQPSVEVPGCVDWQTVCASRGEAHPEQCPTCGPLLVWTGVIPRGGAPPPGLARERAAGSRHTPGCRERPGRAWCAWRLPRGGRCASPGWLWEASSASHTLALAAD